MRLVFLTNSISPHQLPLAREMSRRLGGQEYLYLYTTEQTEERQTLGWGTGVSSLRIERLSETNEHWLDDAEVLMSTLRVFDVFERRCAGGKKTIYVSERWLKPIRLSRFRRCAFPGWLRWMFPHFQIMVRRMRKLLRQKCFWYFAVGVWAQKDMICLCGDAATRHIKLWGYFVETGASTDARADSIQGVVRLLWVGRILALKHVDDIIRAVGFLIGKRREKDSKVTFDIYGRGEEEWRLKNLVDKLGLRSVVTFHAAVSIEQVRDLMRNHDVYVLASDAYEGWGAVVSEALEEGMRVVGTFEAGSTATILPESNLYHAGKWKDLARILLKPIPKVEIAGWTVKSAADRLEQLLVTQEEG